MPDKDSISQHIAWRLFLMSHSILTKKVTAALEAAGCISFDTYDVLVTLSEAPEHSMKMGDLADATFFSNSGISRRVARLEERGLIRRVRCEDDGRVFYATLTASGRKALRKAWPVYREVIEENFVRTMSKNDARAMTETLRTVLRGIDTGLLQRWVEEDRTEAPMC
ncbi:MAG: MarR family transcriptional regulator [Verrucomicrobiales bacterium]|nr:MarR family transcriptional regulator [Verrucomicrobiales bacterium]